MSLSLLRYPGGKTRAAHMLAEHFPYQPQKLASIFFGGGSLEFMLASKGWKINAYDNFHSLACFWDYVKNEPESLYQAVSLYYPLEREMFYNLQQKLTQLESSRAHTLEVAAIFYVLNRASFSGSILSGGCSPDHPRFTQSSINRIMEFDGMDNIDIEHMDFRDSIIKHPNDWLYLDPPYALSKQKSNLYGVKGSLHRDFAHEELFKLLRNRDKWVLSYNDCDYIRELYKDCSIYSVDWAYGMPKEKKSKEIVIKPKI